MSIKKHEEENEVVRRDSCASRNSVATVNSTLGLLISKMTFLFVWFFFRRMSF